VTKGTAKKVVPSPDPVPTDPVPTGDGPPGNGDAPPSIAGRRSNRRAAAASREGRGSTGRA
jgi:hypothetical protein